jgi:four helix bundle protein
MNTINSFKDLIVWQKAMKLTEEIYTLTRQLPSEEIYGISSQIRRAAVSIPSNIAEGNKRSTRKDYSQFLKIANGSAAELETQLLLISSLYSLDCKNSLRLLLEVQKMLTVIIQKIDSK